MTERPITERTAEALVPEEHQDWGSGGYAAGREVDAAEAPAWGPNGFAGTAPGEVAETADLSDEEDELDLIDPEDPDDGPEPGTHPASAIAGR